MRIDPSAVIQWVTFAALVGGGAWVLIKNKNRDILASTYEQLYLAQKEATAQAKLEAAEERQAREREQEDCQRRLAVLESKIDVLEGKWLDQITASVARAVREDRR